VLGIKIERGLRGHTVVPDQLVLLRELLLF
jgi:hypothetical protein